MQQETEGRFIEILQGDITDYGGDAIVNAANNHFWMGAGVAGAIKRRGGTAIEQEAVRQGPKSVGESVITTAGSLGARFVIHAAVMGQDLRTSAAAISAATRSSLGLAESNKVRSIAFPALGTGVGGFPLDEAARIMIGEARGFLVNARYVERITFVLFDREAYEIFENEMKAHAK